MKIGIVEILDENQNNPEQAAFLVHKFNEETGIDLGNPEPGKMIESFSVYVQWRNGRGEVLLKQRQGF